MVEVGLVWGGLALLGAVWRAYKGYQSKAIQKGKEVPFSWVKFLVSVVPAASAGFVMGATLTPVPDLMSTSGLMIAFMFLTGGAGIGSLQGKLPGMKKK